MVLLEGWSMPSAEGIPFFGQHTSSRDIFLEETGRHEHLCQNIKNAFSFSGYAALQPQIVLRYKQILTSMTSKINEAKNNQCTPYNKMSAIKSKTSDG